MRFATPCFFWKNADNAEGAEPWFLVHCRKEVWRRNIWRLTRRCCWGLQCSLVVVVPVGTLGVFECVRGYGWLIFEILKVLQTVDRMAWGLLQSSMWFRSRECSLSSVSLNSHCGYGLTWHIFLSVEHWRVNVESLNQQGSSRTGYISTHSIMWLGHVLPAGAPPCAESSTLRQPNHEFACMRSQKSWKEIFRWINFQRIWFVHTHLVVQDDELVEEEGHSSGWKATW